MKRILLSAFLILFIIPSVFAQDIDEGIQLFNSGDFDRALIIFDQVDSDQAAYYTGRIYFNQGEYLKAISALSKASESDEFSLEAGYALALSHFQLGNNAKALEILFRLKEGSRTGAVGRDASYFYRDLVNFLSLKERYEAFRSSENEQIRFDLVRSAFGKVDLGSAKALMLAYKNSLPDSLSQDTQSFDEALQDSLSYAQAFGSRTYPLAPKGMTYNVAVTLPAFEPDEAQYEISQSLYFGIQLAFERFNAEKTDKKVFLTYRDTGSDPAQGSEIFNDLIWNEQVDAVIGPLFSEVALAYAALADEYQIPLITPLSNSSDLLKNSRYIFQLNPNFEVQGRAIGEYAVQYLEVDTVAIIAEKDTYGEQSALAFRDVMRENDVEVVKYFVRDLASTGYDIQDFTQILDPDFDTLRTYTIDAIYAPFTGSVAPTLINGLLTQVEAYRSESILLGSGEWSDIELSSLLQENNPVFYTETLSSGSSDSLKTQFETEYRLRFGTEPTRFSFIGYDAANVVLKALDQVHNPVLLPEGLRNLRNYRGFATEVSFDGGQVNDEVRIVRRRKDEGIEN